jgi:hypothetical protein
MLPRSHSKSTADGETAEEAEGRSRRTDIPLHAERQSGADVAIGEKTDD